MRPIFLLFLLIIPFVVSGQQRKLLLVAGQSNARGSGDSNSSPTLIDSTAFEYSWLQDSLVLLEDPVGENHNFFQRASTGSSWPSYVKTLYSLSGDTLILVPAARGGTSVTPIVSTGNINWSSTGILLDLASQKTDLAVSRTGLSLSGMVWIQGEKDANGINEGEIDKAAYKAALINFFERVRQKYGCTLPIYMVQTGTDIFESDTGFLAVREAQEEVAIEDRFTSLIYDKAVSFPSLGWMSDNIHYNQKGYNDIGLLGATAANNYYNELNSIVENGPLTFCQGDSLILTAPADFSQYMWSNGATQQTITIKESGSFYVTVSNGSCDYVVQDSVNVIVNPLPTKQYVQYTQLNICAGDSIQLSAPGGNTYNWSNGESGDSIQVTTAGTYFFETVNSFGCVGENSDTVVVRVDTIPSKPILEASGPATFCAGGNLIINLPGSDLSYQWNTGETTKSIDIKSSGQYYANVSNTFGCTSQNSDTIEVVVEPLPERPNIIVNGSTTLCTGDSVLLEFDQIYDNSLWSTGESSTSITVRESGFYFGYGFEGNCLSKSSDTIEVELIERPEPFSILVENDTIFCEGDSVLLSAPQGQLEYLWSNGETTQTIAVYEMGDYSCTISNAGICTTVSNSAVSMVIKPRPKSPFIQATLLDSIYSTISGEEYTWYFNNQILSETEQFIFPEKSGTYQVAVRDNVCYSQLSPPYLVERSNSLSINIFPSPNNGKFTVELNNVPPAAVLLQIADNLGRILYEQEVTIDSPVHRYEFDFPSLSPSVYYVLMHRENRVLSQKFIVN